MNFEQRSTLPVARQPLWDFLMDVPRMAICVPGVDQVTPRGNEDYEGVMRVSLGPIALTLHGTLTLDDRDPEAGRAALHAEATDRRIGGGLRTQAQMLLVERGPGETELIVRAEARLLGKLGEFGQPLIRKKADALMAEFVRNVAARLSTPDAHQRDTESC